MTAGQSSRAGLRRTNHNSGARRGHGLTLLADYGSDTGPASPPALAARKQTRAAPAGVAAAVCLPRYAVRWNCQNHPHGPKPRRDDSCTGTRMTEKTRNAGGAALRDAAALLADGWQEIEAGNGFLALIGPLWQKLEDERYCLGFLVAGKHLNRNGMVHGGMLSSLADSAMGLAARQHELSRRQATIQLGIHYIAAARPDEFVVARCTVRRATRSIIFVDAEIFSGTRLVATTEGIWKTLDTP